MKYHPKIEAAMRQALPINHRETKAEVSQSQLDKRIVEGYGNMWNVRNEHEEKFLKGCWSRSIKDNGPSSNANYQIKFRDRHQKACALFDVLQEDSAGLNFRTKPLDPVPWADDLLIQLRSGTINNFSNGFRFIWDKVEYDEKDDALVIVEGRLFEISAVEVPSDMETYAIRSIDRLELNEEIEGFINDLSKSKQLEARELISRCMMIGSQGPLDRKALAERSQESKKSGLDFNYLIKNL
jgi:Escherichia/Staphylococcus phage prohead protease